MRVGELVALIERGNTVSITDRTGTQAVIWDTESELVQRLENFTVERIVTDDDSGMQNTIHIWIGEG